MRWNYVTKKHDVIVPAYVADLEIALDVEAAARRMGVKAAGNASRKAKDARGALVVKVKSPAPAAVRPITDEHKWMSAEDRAAAGAAA